MGHNLSSTHTNTLRCACVYVFVQCWVGFVMSMDNAHMNEKYILRKVFCLKFILTFVSVKFCWHRLWQLSLLPRREEWQNCFWTSYNKLCQVSSSSIHTLKLYQRATQVEVIYEQQIKQQQQEEQQQCQIFVFTRLIKTKNIVSLHLVSDGV